MSWIQHSYGLLGSAMIILVIVGSVLRLLVKSLNVRRVVLGVVFVLAFIPVNETSLVELLRGVTADLSIPTVLLCVLVLTICLFDRRAPPARKNRTSPRIPLITGGSLSVFFVVVIVVGCVFYPMTMGFTLMDPYAWGYAPRWMLLVCLLLTVVLEFCRQRTAANLILLSVAAYVPRLMESTNLWDYLLDPILFLICLVGCVTKLIGWLRSTSRTIVPSQ